MSDTEREAGRAHVFATMDRIRVTSDTLLGALVAIAEVDRAVFDRGTEEAFVERARAAWRLAEGITR